MPNIVIHGEESIPLLPPVSQEEPQQQPKPQKLSLKRLNERIEELQLDNRLLAERVNDLEKQLDAFIQVQIQVAAAAQWQTPCAIAHEPVVVVEADTIEPEVMQEDPQDIFVPRSKRHFTPKKKASFWSFWFRSRNLTKV